MKKAMAFRALNLEGLTGDELRIAQEDIRKKLEELENRDYYSTVVCKFKKKYEGQWVKLKGSFSASYTGDTGFRIAKIEKVHNAFHQDDPITWQFDVDVKVLMVLNLKEPAVINIEHDFRTEISERIEEPKILSSEKVKEYKQKVLDHIKKQFNKAGV